MRKNIIFLLLISFNMIIFSGCSFSVKNILSSNLNKNKSTYEKSDNPNIHLKLVNHYNKFKGTRYCYGGNGTKCFDCSGFVNYTYSNLFAAKISRSTKEMVNDGNWISKSGLKAGDLVFFKPGRYPRHVGIYVGGSQFIHASSSQGVMKSSLDEDYWKRHYWTARRVLN